MFLYLTEEDVTRFLDVRECIDALEASFRDWGEGRASNRPRSRASLPGGLLHVLPAASDRLGRMAVKAYATTRGGARFVVLLFDAATSDLLAMFEADRLGQIRTGAASGLATRLLSRPDSRVLGLIGSGWQARSQVQAIACVRSLEAVHVYGRDRERLDRFCREMTETCGLPVTPAGSAAEAVGAADIVVTATSSATPVLLGDWLAPGCHVNATGSNRPGRRELDRHAVQRADRIVIDSIEQARLEAGDLLPEADAASDAGDDPLERAVELAMVVAGRVPGRTDDRQITLFKSLGLGLEDLAAASLVYDRAVAAGAGRPFP